MKCDGEVRDLWPGASLRGAWDCASRARSASAGGRIGGAAVVVVKGSREGTTTGRRLLASYGRALLGTGGRGRDIAGVVLDRRRRRRGLGLGPAL